MAPPTFADHSRHRTSNDSSPIARSSNALAPRLTRRRRTACDKSSNSTVQRPSISRDNTNLIYPRSHLRNEVATLRTQSHRGTPTLARGQKYAAQLVKPSPKAHYWGHQPTSDANGSLLQRKVDMATARGSRTSKFHSVVSAPPLE